MEKLAHSIDEVLEVHPGGRTSLFAAIRDGKLKARKEGSRTIILTDEYRQYLQSLPLREPEGR